MAGTGTSAARIEANRRNAQKSTGPRTAEGKARSRANGVKHGLTGKGVVLLGEYAAAVEARFVTLQDEIQPSGLLGQLCVHQLALASVRVERAAREEAAVLEPKLRDAAAEFDRARLAEVDRLFDTIEACPGDHRRRLIALPEGVDRLVAALESARDQLRRGIAPRWSAADQAKFEALFGGTGGQFPATRTDALLIALHGDTSYFPEEATADLSTKEARAIWARDGLIAEVEAELARLAEARAALDLDALDRDRQAAAARVPSAVPEVDRLRKYGIAAARDFSRAYRDLRRIEAEAAASPREDFEHEPIVPDSATHAPAHPVVAVLGELRMHPPIDVVSATEGCNQTPNCPSSCSTIRPIEHEPKLSAPAERPVITDRVFVAPGSPPTAPGSIAHPPRAASLARTVGRQGVEMMLLGNGEASPGIRPAAAKPRPSFMSQMLS